MKTWQSVTDLAERHSGVAIQWLLGMSRHIPWTRYKLQWLWMRLQANGPCHLPPPDLPPALYLPWGRLRLQSAAEAQWLRCRRHRRRRYNFTAPSKKWLRPLRCCAGRMESERGGGGGGGAMWRWGSCKQCQTLILQTRTLRVRLTPIGRQGSLNCTRSS